MNKYDIAGTLKTYAEKVSRARDVKHIKELLKELKQELDLRKIKEE